MPSRRSFTVARSGWMRWGAATLLTQRIFVAAQIVSVVVVLLAIAEHSQSVHCPEKKVRTHNGLWDEWFCFYDELGDTIAKT